MNQLGSEAPPSPVRQKNWPGVCMESKGPVRQHERERGHPAYLIFLGGTLYENSP
jgi:hypothetical protein